MAKFATNIHFISNQTGRVIGREKKIKASLKKVDQQKRS